jgi:3'-phosphoadenosine 5'-phosphosulfate sulfotransferase (PAPS reductase)/FAD synthetase
MRSIDELRMLQALPLELKVAKTKLRIREWVSEFGVEGVYVAFSGGKDSTVLLHIVRELYPDVEAVFVNTGLEYPEIQRFVKSFDNVTILRPKMRFDEVIKRYGYPIIGKNQAETVWQARNAIGRGVYAQRLKRLGISTEQASNMGLKIPPQEMLDRYEKSTNGSKFMMDKYAPLLNTDFKISASCCNVMKKAPSHEYARKTGKNVILATMASESMSRESAWLKQGCNAFDSHYPSSQPMSFWTEQDVLQYIKQNNLPIASVYGDIVYAENPDQIRLIDQGECLKTTGCSRTGCIFCGFGCHLEKPPTRFQRLKETHPRQYEYCIGGGEFNEDGIWQPNKHGLGMGYVFDQMNKIYGEDFIKYK